MHEMKKVIVIGSSGFLGSAVTQELLAQGFTVYATKNKRELGHSALQIIEGGIKGLTVAKLNEINPEAIFHCARPVLPTWRKWGRTMAAWQAKRYNQFILQQVEQSQTQPTLLFASGSLVYGNSTSPHDENAPLNPLSYARQYHRGEIPIVEAVTNGKSKVIVARFPWLLGEGSWFSWFYLKQVKETKSVPLFGTGNNVMTLISLVDAARMMVNLFLSARDAGIYNIISPHAIPQTTFAQFVADRYSGKVTDYHNLFPKGVEKAVIEAFESNILLTTQFPEIWSDYSFEPIEEIINRITT